MLPELSHACDLVFGVADCGKLDEPAKTIGFIAAGRNELIREPETVSGKGGSPAGKGNLARVQIEES